MNDHQAHHQSGHSDPEADHQPGHGDHQAHRQPGRSDHEAHRQTGSGDHEAHRQTGRSDHHAMMIAGYRRRFAVCLVLTLPVLALSPSVQGFLGIDDRIGFPGDQYVLLGLSSIVYLYGGWPFLTGFVDETRGRTPGMMTLIAIAISVAYVYSSAVVFGLSGDVFFWELATLIDVMLLGHWLEMRSIASASSALEELARLLPSAAHRLQPDGSIQDVPLQQLAPGDRVLVRPSEKVPADGVVLDGETSVNEAMLTGESVPVLKQPEDGVIGGSVNGEGAITVEVRSTGANSYLPQVAELVRTAQDSRSRAQNLADRAALVLVLVALGAGVATLVVWAGVLRHPFVFGLARMVTVMVIACPHALGLAIPLVVAVSTSLSARGGVLIKNRDAFERARGIQAVVFDKTGTLTGGRFGVTDIMTLNGTMDGPEMLMYAASVETRSEHPIARGVVASAGRTLPVDGFQSLPGKGAAGTVNGRAVMTVSPGYLRQNGIPVTDVRPQQMEEQGKTVIFVLIDGQPAGAIALADMVRPESKEAVRQLQSLGIRCIMITGDNQQVARRVADETGVDEYFSGVLPAEKALRVKEVQARGIRVAMVGDGVNDAPALAQADVGMAIGAGTDVAVAAADVVLVRDNPLDVVSTIRLSRSTYRKMIQNLIWATGYNVVAIPLAAGVAYGAGVLLDPALGAALMAASTIIVAINARLLRLERRDT